MPEVIEQAVPGTVVSSGALVTPGGAQGPVGSQGAIGPTGPQGVGVVIKGTVANFASLPSSGNTVGDVWITADTGHGWLWQSNSTWSDIGPIQGPPGPQGATGVQGPQGSQGPQGTTGASGAAATVAAGTTTTTAPGTSATVTNAGSSSAAIFNFGIPRGDVGAQGIQGATGGAGAQGPSGTTGAPGSAATIAVGTTSTGTPGTAASVTNAGNSSAAVFNFTIPRGDVGAQGTTGTQGIQGIPGPTAISANPNNKATLGGDSLTMVQGTATGVAATTHAQTVSGDDPQLTNARTPTVHAPSHVTGSDQIALAGATTKGLLNQLSGNTTDFVDGTNACQNLVTAVQPTIWSARLRSFNSVGNPNFEVIQRNIGGLLNFPSHGVAIEDRWFSGNVAAFGGFTVASINVGTALPGTSFYVGNRLMRYTLTVQKASLAANDGLYLWQNVEGSMVRELVGDVHSVSILAQSSVANLKFGISIRNPANTSSLTKLCTLGTANVPTLITLPNLPVFTGGFTTGPGVLGYTIAISLAIGSTYMSPANDTYQNGNFLGAVGQDNFASKPVNSTFDISFLQHEPGPVCSTLMDKPFTQNYDECLRYYQKSYDYGTAIAAVTYNGTISCYNRNATTGVNMGHRFKKPMAKVPGINLYNPSSGALNSVQDAISSAHAVSSVNNTSTESPFYWFGSSALPTPDVSLAHYTADTGW